MRVTIKIGTAALMICAAPLCYSGQSSPQPTSKPSSARLSSGGYRFAGRCAKMVISKDDMTSSCGNFLGIVAKNPELPLFIVPLSDHSTAWEYQITTPGVLSDDEATVTYSISSMIDMRARQEYFYPGECVMSVRPGEPLLHCTMWRDATRAEITREVIFEGNGQWVFDRGSPSR